MSRWLLIVAASALVLLLLYVSCPRQPERVSLVSSVPPAALHDGPIHVERPPNSNDDAAGLDTQATTAGLPSDHPLPPDTTAPTPSALQRPMWAILPAAETARAIRPCSRPKPHRLAGSWTPTRDDVAPSEAIVERRVEVAGAALGRDRAPPRRSGYYRQYVGTYLNGRRVLYVTGLSKAMVDRRPRIFRWRSKAFSGCDFGSQVFGAVFDPTSGRFVSFDFDLDM